MPRKLRKQKSLLDIDDQKHDEFGGEGSTIEEPPNKNSTNFKYTCTLCHKSYKTLNQIKSHLKTKKHHKKHINYHHNNSTISHKSQIPGLIKPSLMIEGNPFIEVIELNKNNSDNESDNIDGELNTIEILPKMDVMNDEFKDDEPQCFFCSYSSDNVYHMPDVHGFFIPRQDLLSSEYELFEEIFTVINQEHRCIYCRRQFNSTKAVQSHMRVVSHCKLNSDVPWKYWKSYQSPKHQPSKCDPSTLFIRVGYGFIFCLMIFCAIFLKDFDGWKTTITIWSNITLFVVCCMICCYCCMICYVICYMIYMTIMCILNMVRKLVQLMGSILKFIVLLPVILNGLILRKYKNVDDVPRHNFAPYQDLFVIQGMRQRLKMQYQTRPNKLYHKNDKHYKQYNKRTR